MNKLERIVESLRMSPYVKEKELGNGISSFNFTRKAFWDHHWTDMSVKARGLFIDTENMVVRARSYDKFFNLGERRDTELDYIKNNWTYPITAYVKENGYLGICSWEQNRMLFCASKSTTEGIYAERFREILVSTLGDKIQDFNEALRKEGLSAIFEVIDPTHDTHIIDYTKSKVVLLDLVYNEWEPGDLEFLNKSYEVLEWWAIKFNLEIKKRAAIIWNAKELEKFISNATSLGYKYNGEWIEGFVLEDSDMRHVKIKTEYYNYWKSWRPVIAAIRKDKDIKLDRIDFENHPESEDIFQGIRTWAKYWYESTGEDIPIVNIKCFKLED